MAKTSSVTFTVSITGDGGTLNYTPPGTPLSNTSAPYGGPIPVALSSGNNTLTPPATAQGVMIIPPTGSAITKTLKGIAGDTGILLNNALPTVLSLPVGGGAFVINASNSETITVLWL